MPDLGPLDIKITATGITEVLSSFKNLEKSVERLQANMTNAVHQGSNRRQQQGKVEADTFLREEVKKTKAIEKERISREREYDKLFREISRAEEKSTREAQSESNKRLRITEKEAAARTRLMRSMVGNAGRIASGAIRLGGAALALGGGLSIAGAFDQQKDLHQEATSLAVATNVPGGSHLQTQDIVNKANDLSKEYNISAADLVKGQHAFVAVGGTPATNVLNQVSPEMARLSKAEGIDPSELGEAMGIALKQNSSLNGNQLIGLMRVLVQQGKEGGIELRRLAPTLATTMASSPLFGGNQLDAQIKLAALAQRAVATSGSPEGASTDINKLATGFYKHSKAYRAAGIETVDNATGLLLPLEQIFKNIFTKVGTDPRRLQKLFPDRGGLRLIESFLPDIKRIGLDKTIQQLTDSFHAQISASQEAADAATVMQDPFEQLSNAFHKMEIQLGQALLPTIEKLIPIIIQLIPSFEHVISKLPKVIDAFDSMITYISKNPIGSIIEALALLIAGTAVQGAVMGAFATLLAPEILAPLIAAGIAFAIVNNQKSKDEQTQNAGQEEADKDDIKRQKLVERLNNSRDNYDSTKPFRVEENTVAQKALDDFDAEQAKKKAKRDATLSDLSSNSIFADIQMSQMPKEQYDKVLQAKAYENEHEANLLKVESNTLRSATANEEMANSLKQFLGTYSHRGEITINTANPGGSGNLQPASGVTTK